MGLYILKTKFQMFLEDESGATAVEYAVLVSLFSIVFIAAYGQLAGSINNQFALLENTILTGEVQ